MSFAYRAYRLLSTSAFMPVAAPVFFYRRLAGKHRESLDGRLGRYGGVVAENSGGRPRIWLHAVSVGEVGAAAAVAGPLRKRLPNCSLIVSTTTEAGHARARKVLDGRTACIYAPLDVPFAVDSALRKIRPDLLAICETELWPNWLMQARRRRVPTALINGRISVRSFRRYMRISPLIGPVVGSLRILSMVSEADAARIRRMGGEPSRIRVNGNAKYDGLTEQARPADARRMAAVLRLQEGQPVLVAGSIRGAELSAVIEAFCRIRARLPRAVLVAAPRHLENAAVFTNLARKRGLPVQRRSALDAPGAERTAPVVVLDTIGELMAAYGTATVAFCGGSLAPMGGQNIMEPAAWGKPVLYGPSMEDFADAREILEQRGGAEQVADAVQLADRGLYYLSRPGAAAEAGQKALAGAATQTGAGRRHAEALLALLGV